eukprot:TRINITY_DN2271_c0_g1_i13.p1 TRINITY_DN2271_c0_g1~~TRINITY_DN2271_c0_g1_i13.p1  ORF type:complete len:156 (-),score=17.63 TRINITY_DN2271_c0_g1_i13:89-556(-)
MGKSIGWVMNAWKRILKSEAMGSNETTPNYLLCVIQKIKAKIESESNSNQENDIHSEMLTTAVLILEKLSECEGIIELIRKNVSGINLFRFENPTIIYPVLGIMEKIAKASGDYEHAGKCLCLAKNLRWENDAVRRDLTKILRQNWLNKENHTQF